MRLRRLCSCVLGIRVRPTSAPGESDLRAGPEKTDERTLLSLSAPASLSKQIEARLLSGATLTTSACDRGVCVPRGLLDLVDVGVEERRPASMVKSGLDALRSAAAIDDSPSDEPRGSGGTSCDRSLAGTGTSSRPAIDSGPSVSDESDDSPAAMRAAFRTAVSMHSCTRTSNSTRIRSEYSRMCR